MHLRELMASLVGANPIIPLEEGGDPHDAQGMGFITRLAWKKILLVSCLNDIFWGKQQELLDETSQPPCSSPSHPGRSRLCSVSNPNKACHRTSHIQIPSTKPRYPLPSLLFEVDFPFTKVGWDYYMFTRGFQKKSSICHYQWEGGQPKPNPRSFVHRAVVNGHISWEEALN